MISKNVKYFYIKMGVFKSLKIIGTVITILAASYILNEIDTFTFQNISVKSLSAFSLPNKYKENQKPTIVTTRVSIQATPKLDLDKIIEDITKTLNDRSALSLEERIQPKEWYKKNELVIYNLRNSEMGISGGLFITIDDCGASEYALNLVEEDNKVRAEMGLPPNHFTFFPITNYFDNENFVEIYKQAIEQGHSFGYHCINHRYSFTKLDAEGLEEEILHMKVRFNNILGIEPLPIIRPPNGAWDGAMYEYAKMAGIDYLIMWNRSAGDKRRYDDGSYYPTEYCIQNLVGLKEGDVVLMHWLPNSVGAMPNVLWQLREKRLTSYGLEVALGYDWPLPMETDISYGAFPFNLKGQQ